MSAVSDRGKNKKIMKLKMRGRVDRESEKA